MHSAEQEEEAGYKGREKEKDGTDWKGVGVTETGVLLSRRPNICECIFPDIGWKTSGRNRWYVDGTRTADDTKTHRFFEHARTKQPPIWAINLKVGRRRPAQDVPSLRNRTVDFSLMQDIILFVSL